MSTNLKWLCEPHQKTVADCCWASVTTRGQLWSFLSPTCLYLFTYLTVRGSCLRHPSPPLSHLSPSNPGTPPPNTHTHTSRLLSHVKSPRPVICCFKPLQYLSDRPWQLIPLWIMELTLGQRLVLRCGWLTGITRTDTTKARRTRLNEECGGAMRIREYPGLLWDLRVCLVIFRMSIFMF